MKYYFCPAIDPDLLMCFDLETIKVRMREKDISEADVLEARQVIGGVVYWCNVWNDVGYTGTGCGKICEKYSPRNGKNGRCRHHSNTYEPTDKKKTIKIKP